MSKQDATTETLPNWLRSGQQMGQGGPGGAFVDTPVSSVAMG